MKIFDKSQPYPVIDNKKTEVVIYNNINRDSHKPLHFPVVL